MENNFTLNGKVTIISAFAGLGKTTAAQNLKYDPMFIVDDLDSGDLRAEVMDNNPEITRERFNQIYVQFIKANYARLQAELLVDPYMDKMAAILFVSAHAEIRQLMSDEGLEFIYVAPDEEHLDNVKLAALQRLEEARKIGFDVTSLQAAYDFLNSPAAADSIKKTLDTASAGLDEYKGQVRTYMIPFKLSDDKAEQMTLQTFLETYAERDPKMDRKFRIDTDGADIYMRGLVNAYHQINWCKQICWDRIEAFLNGLPRIPGYQKGKYTQIGLDDSGRLITITTFKDDHVFRRDILDNLPEEFPMEAANRLGHFGLDSIVMPKPVAEQLWYLMIILRNSFAANGGIAEACAKLGMEMSEISYLDGAYEHACGLLSHNLSGAIFPVERILSGKEINLKKNKKESVVEATVGASDSDDTPVKSE